MKVSINLYGELKDKFIDDKIILEFDSETNIHRLLIRLNLQLDEVIITLVNGKAMPLDYILLNNDRVDIFPPLKGG